MSDVSQGPGWWQASDGRWYPPHLHADVLSAGGSTEIGTNAGWTYGSSPVQAASTSPPLTQTTPPTTPTVASQYAGYSEAGGWFPPRSILRRSWGISLTVLLVAALILGGLAYGVDRAIHAFSTVESGPFGVGTNQDLELRMRAVIAASAEYPSTNGATFAPSESFASYLGRYDISATESDVTAPGLYSFNVSPDGKVLLLASPTSDQRCLYAEINDETAPSTGGMTGSVAPTRGLYLAIGPAINSTCSAGSYGVGPSGELRWSIDWPPQ